MPYAGPNNSELWRHISQKFGFSNFGAIDYPIFGKPKGT